MATPSGPEVNALIKKTFPDQKELPGIPLPNIDKPTFKPKATPKAAPKAASKAKPIPIASFSEKFQPKYIPGSIIKVDGKDYQVLKKTGSVSTQLGKVGGFIPVYFGKPSKPASKPKKTKTTKTKKR